MSSSPLFLLPAEFQRGAGETERLEQDVGSGAESEEPAGGAAGQHAGLPEEPQESPGGAGRERGPGRRTDSVKTRGPSLTPQSLSFLLSLSSLFSPYWSVSVNSST